MSSLGVLPGTEPTPPTQDGSEILISTRGRMLRDRVQKARPVIDVPLPGDEPTETVLASATAQETLREPGVG